MRKDSRWSILTITISLFATNAVAAPMDNHVPTLAATCAACHGTQGHNIKTQFDLAKAPKTLAGIDASFFITQMQKFRSDERKGTVMNHYAKGLNEEEIQALSVYFSSQEVRTNKVLPKETLSKSHQ